MGPDRPEATKAGRAKVVPLTKRLKARLEREKDRTGPVVKWCGESINDPKRAVRRIIKKAGLKNFRFHDTRHTYASRLAEEGVRIEIMQDVLGHASITQTRRYTHLSAARVKEAAEALDRCHKNAIGRSTKKLRKASQQSK